MNAEELKEEHRYRVEERLGILCADAEPTPEQLKIATDEADKAIAELKEQNGSERGTTGLQ